MSDAHAHRHPHAADDPSSDYEPLERALRELLVEKGVFTAEAIQRRIEDMDSLTPANGARLVARAWADADFKARLMEDAAGVLAEEGYELEHSPTVRVVENTERVHNVVVCTLCSCYPRMVLGLPPAWYKKKAYRARVVREPRAVLAEFGTELPRMSRSGSTTARRTCATSCCPPPGGGGHGRRRARRPRHPRRPSAPPRTGALLPLSSSPVDALASARRLGQLPGAGRCQSVLESKARAPFQILLGLSLAVSNRQTLKTTGFGRRSSSVVLRPPSLGPSWSPCFAVRTWREVIARSLGNPGFTAAGKRRPAGERKTFAHWFRNNRTVHTAGQPPATSPKRGLLECAINSNTGTARLRLCRAAHRCNRAKRRPLFHQRVLDLGSAAGEPAA